jgi:hypothetical protein
VVSCFNRNLIKSGANREAGEAHATRIWSEYGEIVEWMSEAPCV